MKNHFIFFLIFTWIITFDMIEAQENYFEESIRNFEFEDKENFPLEDSILFTGSSSIRLWKTLSEDFPEASVINRGFGGSQTSDVVYFFERIVSLYKPKAIVFYCGENDLADGKPVESPIEDFKTFFSMVQESLPDTIVYYVSMKPSPSRQNLQESMNEANKAIQNFCVEQQKQNKPLFYIDVVSAMLDANGKANKDIFVEDMLHMNEAGYTIWKNIIRKHLHQHNLLDE